MTVFTLTENELKVAIILVSNCLNNMGGERPLDLDNDPFTWVDVTDLTEAGYTLAQARGFFSSLHEKGFIGGQARKSNNHPVDTFVTDEAYRWLDTVWDANKQLAA